MAARRFDPPGIKWIVSKACDATLRPFRTDMGEETYAEQVTAFQELLCEYIDLGELCDKPLGDTVKPMGGTPKGGKRFKVRWALPGAGKSGGLRIAVVMYCAELRVFVVGAWLRRQDPSAEDFAAATEGF